MLAKCVSIAPPLCGKFEDILSINKQKQEYDKVSSSKITRRGATRSHIPCMYPISKWSQTYLKKIVVNFIIKNKKLNQMEY